MTLLSSTLTNSDLAQEAIVDVNNSIPGNGVRIDVEPGKAIDFFGRQIIRVGLVDAELLQPLQHQRGKFSLPLLDWNQTAPERLVRLSGFMEHPSVEGSGYDPQGERQ